MHSLRKMNALIKKNAELEEKFTQQEMYSRRENVVIDGLLESDDQSSEDIFKALLHDLDIEPIYAIQGCHRLGKPRAQAQAQLNTTKPRRMIIRFTRYTDKQDFMRIW